MSEPNQVKSCIYTWKKQIFLLVWLLIRKWFVLAAGLGILSTLNTAAENSKHTPRSVVNSTFLGLRRSWSHHFMNQGVCWMRGLTVLVPVAHSQQTRPYIMSQGWELKVSKLPPMAGGYYPGLTVTHTEWDNCPGGFHLTKPKIWKAILVMEERILWKG